MKDLAKDEKDKPEMDIGQRPEQERIIETIDDAISALNSSFERAETVLKSGHDMTGAQQAHLEKIKASAEGMLGELKGQGEVPELMAQVAEMVAQNNRELAQYESALASSKRQARSIEAGKELDPDIERLIAELEGMRLTALERAIDIRKRVESGRLKSEEVGRLDKVARELEAWNSETGDLIDRDAIEANQADKLTTIFKRLIEEARYSSDSKSSVNRPELISLQDSLASYRTDFDTQSNRLGAIELSPEQGEKLDLLRSQFNKIEEQLKTELDRAGQDPDYRSDLGQIAELEGQAKRISTDALVFVEGVLAEGDAEVSQALRTGELERLQLEQDEELPEEESLLADVLDDTQREIPKALLRVNNSLEFLGRTKRGDLASSGDLVRLTVMQDELNRLNGVYSGLRGQKSALAREEVGQYRREAAKAIDAADDVIARVEARVGKIRDIEQAREGKKELKSKLEDQATRASLLVETVKGHIQDGDQAAAGRPLEVIATDLDQLRKSIESAEADPTPESVAQITEQLAAIEQGVLAATTSPAGLTSRETGKIDKERETQAGPVARSRQSVFSGISNRLKSLFGRGKQTTDDNNGVAGQAQPAITRIAGAPDARKLSSPESENLMQGLQALAEQAKKLQTEISDFETRSSSASGYESRDLGQAARELGGIIREINSLVEEGSADTFDYDRLLAQYNKLATGAGFSGEIISPNTPSPEDAAEAGAETKEQLEEKKVNAIERIKEEFRKAQKKAIRDQDRISAANPDFKNDQEYKRLRLVDDLAYKQNGEFLEKGVPEIRACQTVAQVTEIAKRFLNNLETTLASGASSEVEAAKKREPATTAETAALTGHLETLKREINNKLSDIYDRTNRGREGGVTRGALSLDPAAEDLQGLGKEITSILNAGAVQRDDYVRTVEEYNRLIKKAGYGTEVIEPLPKIEEEPVVKEAAPEADPDPEIAVATRRVTKISHREPKPDAVAGREAEGAKSNRQKYEKLRQATQELIDMENPIDNRYRDLESKMTAEERANFDDPVKNEEPQAAHERLKEIEGRMHNEEDYFPDQGEVENLLRQQREFLTSFNNDVKKIEQRIAADEKPESPVSSVVAETAGEKKAEAPVSSATREAKAPASPVDKETAPAWDKETAAKEMEAYLSQEFGNALAQASELRGQAGLDAKNKKLLDKAIRQLREYKKFIEKRGIQSLRSASWESQADLDFFKENYLRQLKEIVSDAIRAVSPAGESEKENPIDKGIERLRTMFGIEDDKQAETVKLSAASGGDGGGEEPPDNGGDEGDGGPEEEPEEEPKEDVSGAEKKEPEAGKELNEDQLRAYLIKEFANAALAVEGMQDEADDPDKSQELGKIARQLNRFKKFIEINDVQFRNIPVKGTDKVKNLEQIRDDYLDEIEELTKKANEIMGWQESELSELELKDYLVREFSNADLVVEAMRDEVVDAAKKQQLEEIKRKLDGFRQSIETGDPQFKANSQGKNLEQIRDSYMDQLEAGVRQANAIMGWKEGEATPEEPAETGAPSSTLESEPETALRAGEATSAEGGDISPEQAAIDAAHAEALEENKEFDRLKKNLENARRELVAAERRRDKHEIGNRMIDYEVARAKFVEHKVNRSIDEGSTLAEARVESIKNSDSTRDKLWRGYKLLGDLNLANLNKKIYGREVGVKIEDSDEWGKRAYNFALKLGGSYASVRTVLVLGSLGGALALTAINPVAGIGALALRRAVLGTAGGVGSYDLMRLGTNKASEAYGKRREYSQEEMQAMPDEQLNNVIHHFQTAAEMDVQSLKQNQTYLDLTGEFKRRAQADGAEAKFNNLIDVSNQSLNQVREKRRSNRKIMKYAAAAIGSAFGVGGFMLDLKAASAAEAAAAHPKATGPTRQEVGLKPVGGGEQLPDQVEYQGGNSAWQEIENQLSKRMGAAFDPSDPGSSEERTWLVDHFKDKLVAHPEEYGLPADADFNNLSEEQMRNLDWNHLLGDRNELKLPVLSEASQENIRNYDPSQEAAQSSQAAPEQSATGPDSIRFGRPSPAERLVSEPLAGDRQAAQDALQGKADAIARQQLEFQEQLKADEVARLQAAEQRMETFREHLKNPNITPYEATKNYILSVAHSNEDANAYLGQYPEDRLNAFSHEAASVANEGDNLQKLGNADNLSAMLKGYNENLQTKTHEFAAGSAPSGDRFILDSHGQVIYLDQGAGGKYTLHEVESGAGQGQGIKENLRFGRERSEFSPGEVKDFLGLDKYERVYGFVHDRHGSANTFKNWEAQGDAFLKTQLEQNSQLAEDYTRYQIQEFAQQVMDNPKNPEALRHLQNAVVQEKAIAHQVAEGLSKREANEYWKFVEKIFGGQHKKTLKALQEMAIS